MCNPASDELNAAKRDGVSFMHGLPTLCVPTIRSCSPTLMRASLSLTEDDDMLYVPLLTTDPDTMIPPNTPEVVITTLPTKGTLYHAVSPTPFHNNCVLRACICACCTCACTCSSLPLVLPYPYSLYATLPSTLSSTLHWPGQAQNDPRARSVHMCFPTSLQCSFAGSRQCQHGRSHYDC